MSATPSFELQVSADDADAAELDVLARRLRHELEDAAGVEGVEEVSEGQAPDGTKSLEAIVVGKLLIKYGPGALRSVVGVVQKWVGQDNAREVTIEDGGRKLVLKGATANQQQQAIDEFFRVIEAGPSG